MTTKWLRAALASLLVLASACGPKQVPPPPLPTPPAPPPRQNFVVLLPDSDGKPSAITVTNPAGTQTLSQPYQAVRVERPDVAPPPPFAMDPVEVRRMFGDTLAALPAPELTFTMYFGENSDTLLPESEAQIPAIMKVIEERRSTAITVIGHTDTTATPAFNYQLGMRRAQGVAALLRARGVGDANLIIDSHGETDQAVKTLRGVAERSNRRVEVIVR
jgi:outer membrane protein OmpA-like peptidoglycan-associated protein